MRLREFTREKARNFVIFWTFIYLFFSLSVIFFLVAGLRIQTDPREPISVFWPHSLLLLFILFSIFVSVVRLWKNYSEEKFDQLRFSRNIAFYAALIIYPLGVLIRVCLQMII